MHSKISSVVVGFLFIAILSTVSIEKYAQAKRQITDKDPCAKQVPISRLEEDKNNKKMASGCPGHKDVDPGVANLILNGIKVDIPREYIDLGSMVPDGVEKGVLMDMVYPNMRPQRSKVIKEKNEISVTISARADPVNKFKTIICSPENPKWCFDRSFIYYHIYAIRYFGSSNEEYLALLPKKEQIKYSEELKVNYFTRNEYGKIVTVYFKGDVAMPNYWLVCKDRGACRTKFYMRNNRLKVTYQYLKHELEEHQIDIHKKIIAKLENFIKD